MNHSANAIQDDWRFCQDILPKVSRTFALNIRVLRGSLHRSVLLSYLWCRIIDTIEDAPAFPARRKVEALDAFAELFAAPGRDFSALDTWIDSLGDLDGKHEEIELVRNADRVGRCFNTLPAGHVSAIKPSVVTMSRGMADYQRRTGPGTQWLRDEQDLKRYCYFVAGTVGEFLTRLFLLQGGGVPEARGRALQARAVDFGLGLQITNITKDLMVDIDRDWCYIPATFLQQAGIDPARLSGAPLTEHSALLTRHMAFTALGHLRRGLEYILLLPRRWRRIRLFCIWPLWMAMETLALLNRQAFRYEKGVSPKISRDRVRTIVRRSSLWYWSNTWLQREFAKLDPGEGSEID